jgi:SGNH domain (fused to AT3 domains)
MTSVLPSNSTSSGYRMSASERIIRHEVVVPKATAKMASESYSRGGLKNSVGRRTTRRVSTMLSALAIALVACSPPPPPPAVSEKSDDTPSPSKSFATTAQVLDAVKAAEQLQNLPGTVAASLQKSDDGGGASSCFDQHDAQKPAPLQAHQPANDINFGECAYGDANGTKLMVMFGDSRAWMFSTPLELIAAKNGWKLRVFSFSGCEIADLEVLSSQTNSPNKECDSFRSAAISKIRDLHPDLVITTSAGDHKLVDGTMPTPAQSQGGWASTFKALAQPGMRLAMIGPIPVWANDDARCLAAHAREVQACSITAAELETKEYEAPQATSAAAAGVVYISPTSWVCADSCEPVIADMKVYRERYHFSSAYSAYLAGAIGEALQPAMA